MALGITSKAQFEEVYEVKQKLGSGGFSVVKLCVEKSTGKEYAAKIINKKRVVADLHRLPTELEILRSVNHPNIIQLKDVFETKEYVYIVTELATGGELFDRIVSRGQYTEREAAQLSKKLVEALQYLHKKGIAHRDLKPENLLLADKKSDTEIKLADFGLSKIYNKETMMQTACGTPGYVAPEILKAQGYGMEVDLWSVGVIAYILLCGYPPFYGDDLPILFESIMTADFDYPPEQWDSISDDAIDFIDSLLVVDPKERLNADQALQHKWLTSMAPETDLRKARTLLRQYTSSSMENPLKQDPEKSKEEIAKQATVFEQAAEMKLKIEQNAQKRAANIKNLITGRKEKREGEN